MCIRDRLNITSALFLSPLVIPFPVPNFANATAKFLIGIPKVGTEQPSIPSGLFSIFNKVNSERISQTFF